MRADVLCQLIAKRIPVEMFWFMGIEIHWTLQEYDTPENRAIVADVISHYDSLAEEYLTAEKLSNLRAERNARLLASDWTQLPDPPLGAGKQDEWRVYRQALRDLPATTIDPANPIWPTPPV